MESVNATGRRKEAIARVYLSEGKGNITINNRKFEEYFPMLEFQNIVKQPLKLTDNDGKFDVKVNLSGGGFKGQAEALSLGLARTLIKVDPENRPVLKENGLLKRDPREVERKKPGRPKARKRFQFSKR